MHVVADRWCALQDALGSSADQWRCNMTRREDRWLRSAADRSAQRTKMGFDHGCTAYACEVTIVGTCARSKRMSGTEAAPRKLQINDVGDALARRRLCHQRMLAWRGTCGPGAHVTVSLMPTSLSHCASGGGVATKGNAQLVSGAGPRAADSRSNLVHTNLPSLFVPAKLPDGYPVYRPGACTGHAKDLRVPAILWQTGRGNSVREHNNASATAAALAAELLGEGLEHVWHNDSAARSFVADNCPAALEAYDCLKPKAFKADLWRYCVMYARGGFYIDAEDVPLVPLSSLVRPCDTLVLANDLCPDFSEGRKKEARAGRIAACNFTSVQISFMAAIPGLPFFRCALEKVISHVRSGYYGPGDLWPTGPPVAGMCLEEMHSRLEYTMELTQGNGALMLESTPVVRTHLLHHSEHGTKSDHYNRLWRNRDIYHRKCARPVPHDHRTRSD